LVIGITDLISKTLGSGNVLSLPRVFQHCRNS
jgi:hypothetical protein